ncbi:ABC transporter ATP-binding protein [soil metagenome]
MPLLELRSLRVRFGGKMAVDGVDLVADAGCVTGLIGPNGAGKTTCFNVITGLQEPSQGTVVLDGVDITRLRPHRRARVGLARTFQRLELFGSLSVRENVQVAVEIAGRADGDRGGRTAGDRAGAAGTVLDRVGLAAVAGERADSLPTGLARLVELARAIATRPRLLLLDEPASGLDEAETAGLARLLVDLATDGMAILLVEHDMALVMEVCRTVHVLDNGSVLAVGTPAEVQRDPAVAEAYLGADTRLAPA